MSKQAILFSIDAGRSMDQRFIDSQSSRLKIALQCLQLTLQQKLFNNSSHQIGFGLFGQNDSDDGNNTLLMPIDKPNIQFVRKVVQLSKMKLDNDKQGGDTFNAISFMIDLLIDHCGKKKYNKRAFIFTNGRGDTKATLNDLRKIARSIANSQIKLNIIPMDFMQTYDFQTNQLDNQMFADPIQQKNSQLLLRLKAECPQNIQIFPASLAIELYKKFRKRDTNPVALYKGKFQIAPNMSIDVCTYKAIRKQKLKSLSKFDLTAPFDAILKKEKDIQIDINYVIEGDTDGKIIDKDKVMNAYQYGNNLVPMDEMIENASRIFQEKNFVLLGFVQSQKIPRHCFLGQVDLVVPQKEDMIGKKLFSAFIYSMLLQKKYALARYIPRNSKRGVNPKLVVLIPFRNSQRQMFYLIQLPTNQSVKDFPFNSLKQSSQKQRQLVSNLVEKMLLVRKDGNIQKDTLNIENLFNPYRQYFYQTIFYRALNQDQNDSIPQLDEVTRRYISPQVNIYESTDPLMQKVKKQFKLKINQQVRDKQKQKKVIIWKDVLNNQAQQISSFIDSQMIQQVGKKFTLDTEDDQIFNPADPVLSFKKMVNNHKKDLVGQALKDLTNYLHSQVKYMTDDKTTNWIQCAKQMRKACVEQKQAEYWDDWFDQAKNVIGVKLFDMLKLNGLGYIQKNNQDVFKPSFIQFVPIDGEIDQLD